ncbi:MAG: hypothetical protein FD179_1288 [Erysipelotrichaceae bacterium]|nr:MAG: hypothetical protein FD179_1288 [Erysipelotrichaceae bacterium]
MFRKRSKTIGGKYLSLYLELQYHLRIDIPNKAELKIALQGVETLLKDAQDNKREPVSIFGEDKDGFYNDLVSAFPSRIGFYDSKVKEHKTKKKLNQVTLLLIVFVLFTFNWSNGNIPVFIFGLSWYSQSNYSRSYGNIGQSNRIILDLINLEDNKGIVLYNDGQSKISIEEVYINNLGEFMVRIKERGGGTGAGGRLVGVTVENGYDEWYPYAISVFQLSAYGESYEAQIRSIEGYLIPNSDGSTIEMAIFSRILYPNAEQISDEFLAKGGKMNFKILKLCEFLWVRR